MTRTCVFLSKTDDKEKMEAITDSVAEVWGVDRDGLTGATRRQPTAFARQVAMSLCREMTTSSFQDIADHFGGKTHATVMFAHKKINRLGQEDSGVFSQLTEAIQKIKNKLSLEQQIYTNNK